MNIYFTASLGEKNKYLPNYKAIVSYIESKGHTIIADHIFKYDEHLIRSQTREELLDFHEQLEKWIKSCDFVIAETSFPSISVGYEISLALQLEKPVLVLYSEGDAPSLLGHHHNNRLVCEKYTRATFPEMIENFINYIQGKSDMRFTFFITPEISAFLEKTSRKEKLPKSVYLRKLILKDMSKHTSSE